jgi:hypothetical protein
MKPVNLNTAPCSPVSSNCVIWQGPNIPCINLCNGDTVSDVVFALATELCGVLDTLNVANYDLTCFGITACGPNDFQALIQFLIAQICALQGITPVPDKSGSTGCPDCLVTVAPCFVVGNQTTMNLTDYVNMIAAKICSIIDQLAIINATLTSLDIRVTTLENAPDPTFTIPSYTIDCSIGTLLAGTTYPIDTILASFTNDVWCPFYTATGTTSEILAAVASECILGTDPSRANPSVDINVAYPTWVNASNTLADTINNIWIALCDLYNAGQSTVAVTDTNTVNLTASAGPNYNISANLQDTGWVNLEGFAYMSAASFRPQCRRIGNEIIFRGAIQVPMGNSLDGAGGTAQNVNSPDEYNGLAYGKVLDVDTSASPDACLMYSSGNPVVPSTDPAANKAEGISIFFRQGLRVIPSTVLPLAINLDSSYTNGNRQFINRAINVNGGIDGVYLATHIGLGISSTGQLFVTAPYGVENYVGSGLQNSSILRSVVSNVISGDNIPLYTNTAPSNSNLSAAGVDNVDITGSTITWPFTVNCNNAYELGGFTLRLDGLSGYINPCETLIATPVPCP